MALSVDKRELSLRVNSATQVYREYTKEKHLDRRREKNKKIMKTKLPRSYKCSCPRKKKKKEKTPLTISHGLQNIYHFFPSKDTTKDIKAPSSTQQHFEFSHQSTNKQTR
jgi:hypothetical protein